MSLRSLRKVLKEQEETQQQQQQQKVEEIADHPPLSIGDESEEESPDSPDRSFRNPFLLLDEDDLDNNQELDSQIAEESLMGNVCDKESTVVKATMNSVSSSHHKAKKKKKKKTKNHPLLNSDDVQRPVDIMLDNLSLEINASIGTVQSKAANVEIGGSIIRPMTSVLQVDPKFLSAENELRRIFGSKVVDSFEKGNQAGSSRHIRGVRRGSHGHKKTILISPSDHWPRWDGSLSMELLEKKHGCHYFRYVHSPTYNQAQKEFEVAKSSHDLNGIASILLYHPYHLDSLITLADYFKFSGEHQMAADAIAKCLYGLECGWHPMFSPLQGNCLLKYGHETNKPLFTTLFAHMNNMDRRGCHRSALEICKLLLSLDSDDPMGAILCIDYFALRAEEYAWLEHFSDEYKCDNSLWLYPNFSYSLAICRFYLENEMGSKLEPEKTERASSVDLMKQALMLHPTVLKKLVAKVPLKEQVWSKILNNDFFGSDQTGNPSLDHLINIYVERSYILWRLPSMQKVLKDSALLVIEALGHDRSVAKDWTCVRNEAFSSEKNEYSHLLVSDFSDSVATMPPDNLQDFLVDPRMREEVQNAAARQIDNPPPGGAHQAPPRDVANRNVLAVLFESMLPWMDYGGRAADPGADDDDDNDNENHHNYHNEN